MTLDLMQSWSILQYRRSISTSTSSLDGRSQQGGRVPPMWYRWKSWVRQYRCRDLQMPRRLYLKMLKTHNLYHNCLHYLERHCTSMHALANAIHGFTVISSPRAAAPTPLKSLAFTSPAKSPVISSPAILLLSLTIFSSWASFVVDRC